MTARAVIFDIDGTLTPMLSWLDFTKALGASVDRHQAIFRDYLDERITYEQSRVELIGLWQATGRADRATVQAIFDGWKLDPAAPALIAALKQLGTEVCLITGSFDVYAAAIARRLGLMHWYANTELIFDESNQLVSYNYVRDQPGEKLRQFSTFLEQVNLPAEACLAVGDGPNDLELFKITGRGVLIDPDPNRAELAPLRAVAWHAVHRLADARAIIEAAITEETAS